MSYHTFKGAEREGGHRGMDYHKGTKGTERQKKRAGRNRKIKCFEHGAIPIGCVCSALCIKRIAG
jgi:hypothetical protein